MTEEEKKRYWSLFLTTVHGWKWHPGYQLKPNCPDELADSANEADAMLKAMEERWPTGAQ